MALSQGFPLGVVTDIPVYEPPDEETRQYIERVYSDLRNDAQVRSAPIDQLGGATLQDMWDQSMRDWLMIVDEDDTDSWVKLYSSTITRDKVTTAVAQLLGNSRMPTIVAQNKDQKVDLIVSRVLKTLKEYADRMDGHPSENGTRKRLRYALGCIVTGTVHVEETMNDDGQCERIVIPNEQVYIPNLWQPDIQKQSHVLRVVNTITYNEAEMMFGHLDNWKFVRPGGVNNWWLGQTEEFRTWQAEGIEIQDQGVLIIYAWYPVPKKDLRRGEKQAKYFNVLINGVPLYKWDNRSAYNHGHYTIAKEIWEEMDINGYYGVSLCWKMRQEKNNIDFWTTSLRAKQKRATWPTYIAWNNTVVGEEIHVPGQIASGKGDPENLRLVHEKMAEGVTASEMNMLQNAMANVDRTTYSPLVAGQEASGSPTAREVATQSSYAQTQQGPTLDRFFALEACLDYLRTCNIVQFWPRKKVNGLAQVTVSDVQLEGGKLGTLEVLFERLPEMDEEELMDKSEELMQEERKASTKKEPKEKMLIDPFYLRNLTLYVTIGDRRMNELEFVKELEFVNATRIFGPLVNSEEMLRSLSRAAGKDEDRVVMKQQTGGMQTQPPGAGTPAMAGAPAGRPPGEQVAQSVGEQGIPSPFTQ